MTYSWLAWFINKKTRCKIVALRTHCPFWHFVNFRQQTQHIYPMFDQCWRTVHHVGPTLGKHWVDVSCLLDILPSCLRVHNRTPSLCYYYYYTFIAACHTKVEYVLLGDFKSDTMATPDDLETQLRHIIIVTAQITMFPSLLLVVYQVLYFEKFESRSKSTIVVLNVSLYRI